MRVGLGYDVHRFAPGRPLVLGGVTIPFDRGLDGHSDADVLLHAIADALLGAAGLKDIGAHFPPGDQRYKGISSVVLLQRVAAMVAEKGFKVGNIDATVAAEEPRLAPYIDEMRRAIAGAMKTDTDRVSVKATTSEGLGFVGRREGIWAMATALLEEK